MEIVKKNVISIICGVIALIAIIASFWPIGGWYTALNDDLAARKKANDAITQLLTERRVKPIFTVAGQAEELDRFPSDVVIAQGRSATNQLHAEAQALYAQALAANQVGHDRLIPGLLPQTDPTKVSLFQQQYRAVTRPGGKPAGAARSPRPSSSENIPDQLLDSVTPPTDTEVLAALQNEWKRNYEYRLAKQEIPAQDPSQPPTITYPNQGPILEKFHKDMENFSANFRHARATKYKMYMEPDALTLSDRLDQGVTPSAADIWYAQMGLWIQQDLARAIQQINAPAKEVANAPVKHLLKITLKPGPLMYETSGATPAGASNMAPPLQPTPPPTPPPSMTRDQARVPDQPPMPNQPAVPNQQGGPGGAPTPSQPPVYAVSVTGRVCGPMYDVVHSTLDIVIEHDKVEPFLRLLQRGQFITVLNVRQETVDSQTARSLGYDYGTYPVVEAHIQCEHLFLRDWTAQGPDAPMPPEVQRYLGVQQTTPPNGQQPAGYGNPVAVR